jgi:hypothetical protein
MEILRPIGGLVDFVVVVAIDSGGDEGDDGDDDDDRDGGGDDTIPPLPLPLPLPLWVFAREGVEDFTIHEKESDCSISFNLSHIESNKNSKTFYQLIFFTFFNYALGTFRRR